MLGVQRNEKQADRSLGHGSIFTHAGDGFTSFRIGWFDAIRVHHGFGIRDLYVPPQFVQYGLRGGHDEVGAFRALANHPAPQPERDSHLQAVPRQEHLLVHLREILGVPDQENLLHGAAKHREVRG